MAGAIVGACTSDVPEIDVLDIEMLRRESRRLQATSAGTAEHGHRYPDLLHWSPPRTQSDVLVETDFGMEVVGLGRATPSGSELIKGPQKDFLWQWVSLELGQTVLVKRRRELRRIHPGIVASVDTREETPELFEAGDATLTLLGSAEAERPRSKSDRQPQPGSVSPKPLDRGVKIEDVLAWLNDSAIEDDSALGYAIRRVARDGTPDQLALLVGTLRARLRR
jgi:hypothetical protein